MSLTKEMFMASLRNRRTGVSDENDDNEEEVEVNRGAGFGSAEINPEEVSRNPERASAGRKPKQREKTGKSNRRAEDVNGKPESKPKGRENKFVKQPDVNFGSAETRSAIEPEEIKRIYSTFPENTNFFF
jgi:hypothetical protein